MNSFALLVNCQSELFVCWYSGRERIKLFLKCLVALIQWFITALVSLTVKWESGNLKLSEGVREANRKRSRENSEKLSTMKSSQPGQWVQQACTSLILAFIVDEVVTLLYSQDEHKLRSGGCQRCNWNRLMVFFLLLWASIRSGGVSDENHQT